MKCQKFVPNIRVHTGTLLEDNKLSVRREYADFQIIEEPWNKYRLTDDTILKVRVIMTDVRIAVTQAGQKKYSADFKFHIGHIIPSKNFVDTPNPKHSQDEIRSADNHMDIKYSRILEKLSEYELDDGTLVKAKLQFKAVKKSKLPLDSGAPCYFIVGHNVWNKIEQPSSF